MSSYKLLSPLQANFILGGQASDNAIIAQETIHSMIFMMGSKGFMTIKFDLKKTFDRLEWISFTRNFFSKDDKKSRVKKKLTIVKKIQKIERIKRKNIRIKEQNSNKNHSPTKIKSQQLFKRILIQY